MEDNYSNEERVRATIAIDLPPLKQLVYHDQMMSILFQVRYNLCRHAEDEPDPVQHIRDEIALLFEGIPEDIF